MRPASADETQTLQDVTLHDPAALFRTSLDRGRRAVLLFVCGGYLLFLLLHSVLLPQEPLSPLGPLVLAGYMALLTTLLAVIPGINLRLLSLVLTLAFTVLSLGSLVRALSGPHLSSPLGFSTWLPLVIVLNFVLLGWRVGGLVLGVVLAATTAILVITPPAPSALPFWVNLLFSSLVTGGAAMIVARFVEERVRSSYEDRERLREARMDALTGALGRAALHDALLSGLARAERNGTPFSLVICDLDNFKQVNDRYGHNTGDEVLRAASRLLRRGVGRAGEVGRWGGEEFVLVLPGLAKTDAHGLAERLRADIAATALAGLYVTASFGVAAYRTGDDLRSVFGRADQAMYEAKNGGRNAVR